MEPQGALLGAFNILDGGAVAMTGTELLLGIQLAQWITRQPAYHPVGTSGLFLVVLILSYLVAAFIVALTLPWISVPFMPCALVVGGVMVLDMPGRGKLFGNPVRDTSRI